MGRVVNVVGAPRTGTRGIVKLSSFLGIRSRFEGAGLEKLTHGIQRCFNYIPYDLGEYPGWVTEWLAKAERYGYFDKMMNGGSFLHAAWGRSMAMHALENRFPNLRFIILYRPIKQVANSWHYKECRRKGQVKPKYPVDRYARAWVALYDFLAVQAEHMNHKPILFEFGEHIKGRYIQTLVDLFRVEPDKEQLTKARKFMKTKYNTCGRYGFLKIDSELLSKAEEIDQRLKEACNGMAHSSRS